MATAENNVGTGSSNQEAGKVLIVYGKVKAISSDGTERVLGPNSPIFEYDRVITESDGKVSIVLSDPAQTQIDIGRMSDIIIDEDVFSGTTAEEIEEVAAEVEEIQEAILAEGFDPTVELEAPAAGGTGGAGGGHPIPEFDDITPDGQITSGAETVGITSDTIDPIPAAVEDTSRPSIDAGSGGEVWEAGLPDGSAPGVFNTTTSGNLTITHSNPDIDSTALIEIQDANGNWVPVSADNTLVVGEYGNLYVDLDGAWRYELTDNTLDHPDNVFDDGDADRGADDPVLDNFATRVTDTSGDMTDSDGVDVTETLTIAVNDDGPTAIDDETSGAEDEIVTYNVINNTDGTSDTPGADSATLTGAVLAPEYEGLGEVSFNENGEITFDPVAGFDGPKVEIDYTLTDGDGDLANATLTILYPEDSTPEIVADKVLIEAEEAEVWESDLPDGSGGGSTTDSGQFVIDTGNDTVKLLEVQDVNGNWIAITANNTIVQGEYGQLSVDTDGSWEYEIFENTLDHPDNIFTDGDADRDRADQVFDQFATRVTDSDDDSTFEDGVQDSEVLTIAINDDGPEALDDFAGTYDNDTTVTYNVMGNDVKGADDVTELTGATVVTPGAGTITGFTSTGSITFDPNADFTGTVQIDYTITDADGDNSTASLFINYNEPPPDIEVSRDLVEGDTYPVSIDLPAGQSVTPGSYTGPLGGTLTVSAGGQYTYTAPVRDHGIDGSDSDGADSEVFTFDLPNGSQLIVNFNILDTDPTAAIDTNTVVEGGTLNVDAANGVLTNDTTSADGGKTVTTTGALTGTAGGTLTMNADGSYTYNAPSNVINTGGAPVPDVFNYTMTDADGSTSSSTLTINITDTGPAIGPESGTVDESALPEGTGGGTITASGSLDITAGQDSISEIRIGGPTGTLVPLNGSTQATGGSQGSGIGSLVITGNGDGTYDWTYTLNGNTEDHNQQDTTPDTVTDNFTLWVKDADGSTASNSLNITINDDDIQVTQVSDGHIANEAGLTLNGIFNVIGADNSDYLADLTSNVTNWSAGSPFADSGETSGGPSNHVFFYVNPDDTSKLIAYTDSNTTTSAYTGATGQSLVFTLDVNPESDGYVLQTFGQLDTFEELNFDISNLTAHYASGPQPYIYITDAFAAYSDLADIPSGENIVFTATTTDINDPEDPDLVNPNANYFAVDNLWVGDDYPSKVDGDTVETLVLDFEGNSTLGVKIVAGFQGNPDVNSVHYTVYLEDGTMVEGNWDGAGKDSLLEIEGFDQAIDKVELTINTDNPTPFQVTSISLAQSSTADDINLSFNVDLLDSDQGNSSTEADTTQATINIEFDGDNTMTGTLGVNDVFVGGPEAESFDPGQGFGDADIVNNFDDTDIDTLIGSDTDDIINS